MRRKIVFVFMFCWLLVANPAYAAFDFSLLDGLTYDELVELQEEVENRIRIEDSNKESTPATNSFRGKGISLLQYYLDEFNELLANMGTTGRDISTAPVESGSVTGETRRIGEAYTFETEILPDGMPRYAVSRTDYETICLTVTVKRLLTPEYYAKKYETRYKLIGNEAGAVLELKFEKSTGSESIDPQNVLSICFESEDGTVTNGYQLMNAEIAGDYGERLEVGDKKTYYKRFAYTTDPEMDYLTITYYVGGKAMKVYFELDSETGQ